MLQTESGHSVEPVPHQLRIAGRIDATTIFRQERALGDDVQAGKQRQPFIQHCAHDVQMPLGAEQLQSQQTSHGVAGRDHLRAGQSTASDHLVKAHLGQRREE